jgi:hypothetical protein
MKTKCKSTPKKNKKNDNDNRNNYAWGKKNVAHLNDSKITLTLKFTQICQM